MLYTEEQVEERIREVAAEISERYRGRDLKLIGVLKGSVFFLTALARALTIPVKIDLLHRNLGCVAVMKPDRNP